MEKMMVKEVILISVVNITLLQLAFDSTGICSIVPVY
jgi:hypothetical protein